jgi:hypothetical protein
MQAFYDEHGNLISVEFSAEELREYSTSNSAHEEPTQNHDSRFHYETDDFADRWFKDYYDSCPTNLVHYELTPEEISDMAYWDAIGLEYG